MRTGQPAMTVTLGSNNYSACPQYGSIYLDQSYLCSPSHSFTPSLSHSVKVSYTRHNRNNSYDPSLKSCQ
jgi:hypothetical protein